MELIENLLQLLTMFFHLFPSLTAPLAVFGPGRGSLYGVSAK